jgi:peptide/nickel transport system substrate-binding protein
VIFRLDRPNSVFLDKLAHLQCTLAVLHKDSINADGTWKEPVATGPFKLGEWKKGESVLLVPFEGYSARSDAPSGYAGSKKAYHPVRFVVIPDASSQRAAIESGQIHLMPFVIQDGVPKAQGELNVFLEEGLEWNILLMQTRDPLLKDIRIRKAIAHAVDVPALVKAASQGRARPNPSVVPSSSRYYSDAHKTWVKYDPAEARRLLKEAGYNGQAIMLQVNKNYPNMYDNAVIMQDMLGRVGIKVDLQLYDWPTQLANYASGNFQAMMFGYSARLDPGLGYLALTGNKDVNRGMQWDNRKADELIARANKEMDFNKRKKIFEELHALFVEDIPAINLYNHPLIDVSSKRLVGYKPWSTSKSRLFNVQLKP